MLALTSVIVKLVLSVFVFRHLEYTMEAVAMLAILPPFQAVALSLLARSEASRRRLPHLVELASRPSLQVLWAAMALAVGAWVVASTGGLLPEPGPRELLGLISGVILGGAGVTLLVATIRRPRGFGANRLLPCAVVCIFVAVVSIASGLGCRVSPWPTLAVVTAASWASVAAVLLLCLVRAAEAMRPAPALLLEVAAVLAAVTMSVVPLALYLRPYLGAAWLDPGRVALLIGAILTLTASTDAEAPPARDDSPPPATPSTTVRAVVALWLTLQSSYLVGWVGLGFMFAGSPDLTTAACTLIVLIPVVQTFSLLFAQSLRRRGKQLA